MENSAQRIESPVGVGSRTESVSRRLMPTDDQFFLLYFIMGTYFAPDLKGELPQKSVLQRRAEGLPQYSSDQLAGSQIKTVEVERVYYHVLRKADSSMIVKQAWLHDFFHGKLAYPAQETAAGFPQFDDLFPPQLHPHLQFKNRLKIIKNIVFIHNPDISYIWTEDVKRFKRLTGLKEFLLDRDATRLHTTVGDETLLNAEGQQVESPDEFSPPGFSSSSQETGFSIDASVVELAGGLCCNYTPASSAMANNNKTPRNGILDDRTPLEHKFLASLPTEVDSISEEEFEPRMIYLPSRPTKEELNNIVTATKSGLAMTGSIAVGKTGPIVGLIDIGECEDAYLFRISLPGVKRDEREFSCEVENDGKVLLRGVTTTGEKTVCRYSQVFKMQSRNLCPPGLFSMSFNLPGPVDPQQFAGNFGTDGILEGIVMKGEQNRQQVIA